MRIDKTCSVVVSLKVVVNVLRHFTHGMVYPCVEILLSCAVLACYEALDIVQAYADIIDINRAFRCWDVTEVPDLYKVFETVHALRYKKREGKVTLPL